MPEMPEVEGLRTFLEARLVGRTVVRTELLTFSALKTFALPLSALERRNRHHALLGRTVFRRGAPGSGTRWDRDVEAFRTRALEVFDTAGIDVLMTPALADVPPPATEWHERSWARNVVACARFAPMSVGWNLLGWPAMSVPAGQVGASGGRHLPTAVQLVGRPGSEADLLAVAGELERRHPWRRTAP